MEYNCRVSTDKSKLDLPLIFNFLSNSYWGKSFTYDSVKKSIHNSLCFGLYTEDKQIGFARVVTDFTRFAYLADVFILPELQGKGYGRILLTYIMEFEDLKDVGKWLLRTTDAAGLYEKFGFTSLTQPEKFMERQINK